jgi:hypothetical protein
MNTQSLLLCATLMCYDTDTAPQPQAGFFAVLDKSVFQSSEDVIINRVSKHYQFVRLSYRKLKTPS